MYRQFSNRFAEMDHKWSDRLDPSESGGSGWGRDMLEEERRREGQKASAVREGGRLGEVGKEGPKVAAVRCENGRAVSGRRGQGFSQGG